MQTIPEVDRRPAHPDWAEIGSVLIKDVVDVMLARAVADEAHERIDLATPYDRDEVSSRRDGSFAGPVHCAFIPAGPALQQLAFNKDLLAAVREATGMPRLVPRGGSVVRYERGDFQGLHTDSVKATVTCGIALTDALPPMWWGPTLRDAFPNELAELVAERGILPECAEFTQLGHPQPADGTVRAWAGYSIPHWRTPHPRDEVGLLATWSYMDL
ncbi:hypothetical protein OG216_19175 [Streptomycetaceae bacterium NBC_01309]